MDTDSNLQPDELFLLEGLVDSRGIDNVLMALCEICDAKSEHIIANWQDIALAKRWATVAGACGTAVTHAGGL